MIFIFGYHPSTKEIGPVEEINCSNCNNKRHWILTKVTSFISFFFIPIIPVKFEYFQYCPVCNIQMPLTKDEFVTKEPVARLNREALETNMSNEEYEEKLNAL